MTLGNLTLMTAIAALGLTFVLAYSHRRELVTLFNSVQKSERSTDFVDVYREKINQILSKIETEIEQDAELIQQFRRVSPGQEYIVKLDNSFEIIKRSVHEGKKIAS